MFDAWCFWIWFVLFVASFFLCYFIFLLLVVFSVFSIRDLCSFNWCFFKLPLSTKDLPQNSHLNALLLVCMRKCSKIFYFLVNFLRHVWNWHWKVVEYLFVLSLKTFSKLNHSRGIPSKPLSCLSLTGSWASLHGRSISPSQSEPEFCSLKFITSEAKAGFEWSWQQWSSWSLSVQVFCESCAIYCLFGISTTALPSVTVSELRHCFSQETSVLWLFGGCSNFWKSWIGSEIYLVGVMWSISMYTGWSTSQQSPSQDELF